MVITGGGDVGVGGNMNESLGEDHLETKREDNLPRCWDESLAPSTDYAIYDIGYLCKRNSPYLCLASRKPVQGGAT